VPGRPRAPRAGGPRAADRALHLRAVARADEEGPEGCAQGSQAQAVL